MLVGNASRLLIGIRRGAPFLRRCGPGCIKSYAFGHRGYRRAQTVFGRRSSMKLSKLLAVLAVASVALAACGTSTGGTANKGTIKLRLHLPQSRAQTTDPI